MRDNQESKIEVAQEVPFLTGQYTTTTGTSSAFQTIQREQVGTILTVTPQINEGDAVLLKLEVESSSLAASSAGAVDLITNKRTITTTVLIPDGGTLVLGGLIAGQGHQFRAARAVAGPHSAARRTVPHARHRARRKTNLMVFLQPHILRDDHRRRSRPTASTTTCASSSAALDHENTVLPLQPFQKLDRCPICLRHRRRRRHPWRRRP